jgi:cytochrome c553
MKKLKVFLIALLVLPMLAVSFQGATELGTPIVTNDDIVAEYKKSCQMCHSPKAEKAFDLEKSDEEHIEAILKGKKAARPPHMPEYESKGMTAERAAELVAHMRKLRAGE